MYRRWVIITFVGIVVAESFGGHPAAVRGSDVYPKCITRLSSCACKTDQGVIDLSPLDSKSSTPAFTIQSGSSSDTFSYNPCSPFTDQSCTNVAVCYKYSTYISNGIGTQDSATFVNLETSGMLAIQYKQPSPSRYTSIVTLKCDKTQHATFTAQSQSDYTYQFTLTSRYACPSSSGGGISVGTVLCIIAVILLVVYLVVGIIYMRCCRHATGIDVIPHIAFWREAPGTIKDGAAFVVSPITKKTKTGYDSI